MGVLGSKQTTDSHESTKCPRISVYHAKQGPDNIQASLLLLCQDTNMCE